MPRRSECELALSIFILLLGLGSIRALSPTLAFYWEFTGPSSISLSLGACDSLPIAVSNAAGHGVPPFYMMALAVGGAPITSYIGTNASNLSWTVEHPVGTKLLLQVVDATGASGGVAPALFTVIDGAASCSPKQILDPAFSISANVTDKLTTCDSWGLIIHGGSRPYNVTLAALNAPGVTNLTLGPQDFIFTYVNRAESGTQLIDIQANQQVAAAVSDADGQWATGSPLVQTQGPQTVDCPNFSSSSGIEPTSLHPSNGTGWTHISVAKRIGIIISAAVAGISLLVVGIWAMRRRFLSAHTKPLIRVDSTGVTPFYTYPGDVQTASPASAIGSSILGHKRGHSSISLSPMTASMAESGSFLSPSTVASSSAAMNNDLPPPYAAPPPKENRSP
ncbi:hypothetical protein R3P38DRAFT_2763100 [Favolaschia claudopus]|uniref:Uncharacterized protein n=1 Tax=Favolaschia claudopus TaxID=2862362 RepID=A0AAW0DMP4_9AGAR